MKVNAGSDNSLDLITTMVTFPRAVQTFPLNRNHFLYHHLFARFSPLTPSRMFSFAVKTVVFLRGRPNAFAIVIETTIFLITKNEFWQSLTTSARVPVPARVCALAREQEAASRRTFTSRRDNGYYYCSALTAQPVAAACTRVSRRACCVSPICSAAECFCQ